MPIAKRRRRRNRFDWVAALRDHAQVPEYGTAEYNDLLGWLYFEDQVEGLPAPNSAAGRKLIKAARPAFQEVLKNGKVTIPS